MKKYSHISELGSMMIEALAMLALIAMVTPILYKKSAERTTELQDINAASELRAIIKAVDDYVSANYDTIKNGGKIENTCKGNNKKKEYTKFKDATDAYEDVPIGHFCEFLPYGILDDDGNAKKSRLFSEDYKIILKLKGSNDADGDKVITAFVVTDPQSDDGLPTVRASSIASMIGGNGGYVSETSGSGDEASGKISGNLGIWGIDNTRSELGISVKKGAVVAASIQGISSQNAKLDLTGVLYREEKSDPDLNTMSTTLYMGAKDAVYDGNNIVNIGQLIVGAQESDNSDDRLYIKSGDIRLGEEGSSGNIFLDGTGDITLADGGIELTGGDIVAHSKQGEVPEGGGEAPLEGGNLYIDGEISAAGGAFTVATDGAVEALSYVAGGSDNPNAVQIHVASDIDADKFKTYVNEPLEVVADGDCTYMSNEGGEAVLTAECALYVKGNALIDGDLTVTDTFSAKNLHAQEKLTVGGTGADESKALSVIYNKAAGEGGTESSSLNFGQDLLRVNHTGDNKKGNFNFADFIYMDTDAADGENAIGKQFKVDSADIVDMTTSTGTFLMNNEYLELDSSQGTDYATLRMQAQDSGGANVAGTIRMEVSNYLSMNAEAFVLEHTGSSDSDENNTITSEVRSFRIKPTDIEDDNNYFQVSENTEGSSTDKGQVLMKGIKTYMLAANQYLRDKSEFHVQSSSASGEGEGATTSYSDVVRIAEDSDSDSQIDISGEKIVGHEKGKSGNSGKVLKIDFNAGITEGENTSYSYEDENYPVYIRRGAIELKEVESGKSGYTSNTHHNYVQADRFVSNHSMETGALLTPAGGDGTLDMNYEINPAYTSIMHDIKLTTRGGARLSDILPDFINKGIYVVDNTYPADGESCSGTSGKTLEGYKGLDRANKQSLNACTSITQEVSPWAGFVPTPTCPPGYSKVITLTPASFAMAQAGIPYPKDSWSKGTDLSVPYVVKSPYDYLDETTTVDAPPTPLYYQKNTWLKSFVDKYPSTGTFEGWDVGMGFIYPYNLYSDYIGKIGGITKFDNAGCVGSGGDSCVVWNMFPVYAGTLEGYATVYCYFNRGGKLFNESLVDTEYDQLNNFRNSDSKGLDNAYQRRLNDDRNPTGESVW